MNHTNAQEGPDMGDLLTALDDAAEAFAALGELVVTGIESGHQMSKISHGLFVLFDQQTSDMRSNIEGIRQHRNRAPAAPTGKLDPEHPDYQAVVESNQRLIAEMREQRALAQKLRLPVIDTEEIAVATNVDQEAVRRVIDKLVAGLSDPDIPEEADTAPRPVRRSR